LAQVLEPLHNSPATQHPDLVVGLSIADDAGVFRTPSGDLLVQTVDFFTPVVDDPYDWGRVTAANALSDVYAMGGTPMTALQMVGWPRDVLPFSLLERVIAGGLSVMEQAGCTVVGGHSVDDQEPKYGFAVTGIVSADELLTVSGALPGDKLVLTKPLGTGIAATAIKQGVAPAGLAELAVETMAQLNDLAATNLRGARAMTDVTGFGLLGHLIDILKASGVGADLDFSAIPILPHVLELAADGVFPGGSERNLEAAQTYTDFGSLPDPARRLLADAQTSGGLLAAVPATVEADGWVIGVVTSEAGAIRVR
jgi:selenide,water dikinase